MDRIAKMRNRAASVRGFWDLFRKIFRTLPKGSRRNLTTILVVKYSHDPRSGAPKKFDYRI